jgi:hypothetical protein
VSVTDPQEPQYRLSSREPAPAAEVLLDAFREGSIWRILFKGISPEQQSAAFETPLIYCTHCGNAFAPSDALEGIVTWLPGGVADMSAWRMIRSSALRSGLRMGHQLAGTVGRLFQPVSFGNGAAEGARGCGRHT